MTDTRESFVSASFGDGAALQCCSATRQPAGPWLHGLSIIPFQSFSSIFETSLGNRYRGLKNNNRILQRRMSYTHRSLATYPRPSLTSASHLMSVYVLCSVYGSKTEFTMYTLYSYMARVWKCRVTYDQHPKTNYSTEFPIYLSPRPITIS